MTQDRAIGSHKVRCAIYTRQATDDGRGGGPQAIRTQHESAEAYIAENESAGWKAVTERFDDIGYGGTTMDRPALRRLLADAASGRLDCIVVQGLDRLTRSIPDLDEITHSFHECGVSLVTAGEQLDSPIARRQLQQRGGTE